MAAHDEDLTRSVAAAPLAAHRTKSLTVALIMVALAATVPLVAKNFLLFQLTMVMVYGIAILGLQLLTGFNGQFSLGHSAFYGLGAYTMAIMVELGGVHYGLALPAAAAACFFAGFLFGLPALRLEGLYLALATFGLALATPQILKLAPLEPWTGGVQGLAVIRPEAPFGLPLSGDQWLYYFTFCVGTLLYIGARNLIASRTGRAMMAIRENPIAARAIGVNTGLYKSLTFGVSAMYTGVAGALGAIAVQYVAPDSFTIALSIGLFVGLVVGGVAWLPGALFGGAFVLFVPNVAESLSKGLSGAVYGSILILVIFIMPSGVGGLARVMRGRLERFASRN